MHTRFNHSLRRGLPAALVALALVPATAAGAVTATLRVQGPGKSLDNGTAYSTGTQKVTTDRRAACGGSGKKVTLAGPNAMGILVTAAARNPLLRPVGISDKYSFGLTVCGIGNYVSFSSTSFWLYKVDHKSPAVGADQYKLKAGDQVLWYFEDTAKGINTGKELALSAPRRAHVRRAFSVRVWAYDANGNRKAASGARVAGHRANSRGIVTFKVSKARRLRLRATRGHDVPSAAATVVVR